MRPLHTAVITQGQWRPKRSLHANDFFALAGVGLPLQTGTGGSTYFKLIVTNYIFDEIDPQTESAFILTFQTGITSQYAQIKVAEGAM